MADSVDRVFVHALSTVKRIPKTGAVRPPAAERLRLYGLYKQAMEGDVDGVMERPSATALGLRGDDLQREMDKWDAWNSQRGLAKTEAKRRYIETLIGTMHKYANTGDAKELVSELEFVWTQVKNNTPSLSSSSPKSPGQGAARSDEGPMKILSPMSELDEAERESRRRLGDDDDDDDDDDDERGQEPGGTSRWSKRVERALVKLSTEVAALREQITTGREWRFKKEMSWRARVSWLFWAVVKHLVLDLVALSVVLIWMRKRRDRRLEDLVRAMFRLGREYVRSILPAR
ncbi:related to endozepine [Cephalotrichum gorgonifer]|uniref:Related to endozepine n=1 Tax=Cephalotrichum gorgonifer TaxID=2041049 RepID=A0AAE8N530_9PEZI|nr:related to endozepine [Cephalotrichum gorgonifer]